MLFRSVLDAVAEALRGQGWLTEEHSVTLVRDLHGQVRLMIESPTAGQDPDPDTAGRQQLERALTNRIGAWLGAHTPVWQASQGRGSAIARRICELRVAWELPNPPPCPTYLVERHVGRHGWVGDLAHAPPWTVERVDNRERPPIVVFFSQKGGVGRSTAAAATALHLARQGNRILLVDLDLEAPGLGEAFLDLEPGDPGMLDLLVGPEDVVVQETANAARAVNDPDIVGNAGGDIFVLPAGSVDDGYVQQLARLDLQGAHAAEAVTSRIRAVLDELVRVHDPSMVLIDARAGFHDVGGVALASLCHGAVFVGLPNEPSFHGLVAVCKVLARAGHDDEGDPRVWLQVVQGMAPEILDDTEERAFRVRAYDLLSEHYYLEGAVPGEATAGAAHDVLPLRWTPGLRGKGGRLNAGVIDVLAGERFRALAERIAAKHVGLAWRAP